MGGWRSTGQVGMKNCGGVAFVCFSSSPCACLVSIQLFFQFWSPKFEKLKINGLKSLFCVHHLKRGGRVWGTSKLSGDCKAAIRPSCVQHQLEDSFGGEITNTIIQLR
jgi:hypothetical protein